MILIIAIIAILFLSRNVSCVFAVFYPLNLWCITLCFCGKLSFVFAVKVATFVLDAKSRHRKLILDNIIFKSRHWQLFAAYLYYKSRQFSTFFGDFIFRSRHIRVIVLIFSPLSSLLDELGFRGQFPALKSVLLGQFSPIISLPVVLWRVVADGEARPLGVVVFDIAFNDLYKVFSSCTLLQFEVNE